MTVRVWYDPAPHIIRVARNDFSTWGAVDTFLVSSSFLTRNNGEIAPAITLSGVGDFYILEFFDEWQDEDGNRLGQTVEEVVAALEAIVAGPVNAGFERYLGTIGAAPATYQTWPAAKSGDFVIALDNTTIEGVSLAQGFRYRCTTDNTDASTPDNWELLQEPGITASDVGDNMRPQFIVDNIIARPEQITQVATQDGFLSPSPLRTLTDNGVRSVQMQRTRDVVWSEPAIGSRTTTDETAEASWSLVGLSPPYVAEELGITIAPNSGGSQVDNVRLRIRDAATDTVLAYSPSQDVWDAGVGGLMFNVDSQTDVYLPLTEVVELITGEEYLIDLQWDDGRVYHADDDVDEPTYRTLIRAEEGVAVGLATDDILIRNGISPEDDHIQFERTIRSPRVIEIDDGQASTDSYLSMRGGIFTYRGQGYDVLSPYVDTLDGVQSISRTFSRGGGLGERIFGDGTPLTPNNSNEIIIADTAFRQSTLSRIRVTQTANAPEIANCNVQLRLLIGGTRETVFDLQRDTGNTFTLNAGGVATDVINLPARALIPLIDTRTDSNTVDLQVVIIVPSGVQASLENASTGDGAAILTINPVTIADLVEARPPISINQPAGAVRDTTPTLSNRNRWVNRLILFTGTGDHTFTINSDVFRDGTDLNFRNDGTGKATLVLNDGQRFAADNSTSLVLDPNDFRSFVNSTNEWFENGQITTPAPLNFTQVADQVAVRSRQLPQLQQHAGFLEGSLLETVESAGVQTVQMQRRRDVVWSASTTGSRMADGPTTATFTVTAPEDGQLVAIGVTGSATVEGLKVRIRQVSDNAIVAYSPSQAVFDDETLEGLRFNHPSQALFSAPLDRAFSVTDGTSYEITLEWTSGALRHNNAASTPIYAVTGQMLEGDAGELATLTAENTVPFEQVALNALAMTADFQINDDNWSTLNGGVIRRTEGTLSLATSGAPQAGDTVLIINDGPTTSVSLVAGNTVNGQSSFSINTRSRITLRAQSGRAWVSSLMHERTALSVEVPVSSVDRPLTPQLTPLPRYNRYLGSIGASGADFAFFPEAFENETVQAVENPGTVNNFTLTARVQYRAIRDTQPGQPGNWEAIPLPIAEVPDPVEVLVRHADFSRAGTSNLFEIPANTLESRFIFNQVSAGGSTSSFQHVWALFRGARVVLGSGSVASFSANYRLINKVFTTNGQNSATGEAQVGGTARSTVVLTERIAGNNLLSGELIVYGDRNDTGNIAAIGQFTALDAFGQVFYASLGAVCNDRAGPTHVSVRAANGLDAGTITQYRRIRPS